MKLLDEVTLASLKFTIGETVDLDKCGFIHLKSAVEQLHKTKDDAYNKLKADISIIHAEYNALLQYYKTKVAATSGFLCGTFLFRLMSYISNKPITWGWYISFIIITLIMVDICLGIKLLGLKRKNRFGEIIAQYFAVLTMFDKNKYIDMDFIHGIINVNNTGAKKDK